MPSDLAISSKHEIEELKNKIQILEERIRTRRILEKDRDQFGPARPILATIDNMKATKQMGKSKSTIWISEDIKPSQNTKAKSKKGKTHKSSSKISVSSKVRPKQSRYLKPCKTTRELTLASDNSDYLDSSSNLQPSLTSKHKMNGEFGNKIMSMLTPFYWLTFFLNKFVVSSSQRLSCDFPNFRKQHRVEQYL